MYEGMEEYKAKMAEYEMSEEDDRVYGELFRKNMFSALACLAEWYMDEHKCSLPWLDGDTVEKILDDAIERAKSDDSLAYPFEIIPEVVEEISGIKL